MTKKLLVGWKEKGELPELDIDSIKIKIDTGAKTSSLHAVNIKPFLKDEQPYVLFETSANRTQKSTVKCESRVIDYREITSSNGQLQSRYVIKTPITLGNTTWDIEVTLTDRENMRYRMLLGREAMKNILVSPHDSYLLNG